MMTTNLKTHLLVNKTALTHTQLDAIPFPASEDDAFAGIALGDGGLSSGVIIRVLSIHATRLGEYAYTVGSPGDEQYCQANEAYLQVI